MLCSGLVQAKLLPLLGLREAGGVVTGIWKESHLEKRRRSLPEVGMQGGKEMHGHPSLTLLCPLAAARAPHQLKPEDRWVIDVAHG